jgi:predicted CXXCH cytochrome family protein
MFRPAFLVVSVLLSVVVVAVPVFALTQPNMTGGAHDFRTTTAKGPKFTSGEYADATGLGRASDAEVCKACHIPHNARQASLLWPHNYDNGQSEPGTATQTLCMGCHDGLIATAALPGKTATLPAAKTLSLAQGHKNHPVGINYPSGNPGYEPTPTPPVLLDGGQVTCKSCHDPHSTTGQMLRMSNANSALCVACHKK